MTIAIINLETLPARTDADRARDLFTEFDTLMTGADAQTEYLEAALAAGDQVKALHFAEGIIINRNKAIAVLAEARQLIDSL